MMPLHLRSKRCLIPSKLDAELKREVLAKKRKLVNSTKKQDRRDSKNIIKNL